MCNVFSNDQPKVPFTNRNDVIEAFASNKSDEALGEGELLPTLVGIPTNETRQTITRLRAMRNQ